MPYEMKLRNVVVGRLQKGEDLVGGLLRVALDHGVQACFIHGLGALRKAKLAYYRQDTFEYADHLVEKPTEVLSLTGNISMKDGRPMVHVHLTLGDEEGRAMGGHALPGCEVFALEFCMFVLDEPPLVRERDEHTNLYLWKEPKSLA